MSDLQNALVEVKQGKLQGCEDKGVKVFRGIPYAAPPVGERRFRAPEDPGRWRGVRDATKFGAASIQAVMAPPPGVMPKEFPMIKVNSQYEEDCLYLNVWTPAKADGEKLPVFMWIHGGGLVAGSGVEPVCQGADFAREKNVVVVTINYRLGFFGFFCHPEVTAESKEHTSGNYALLDMRKAALWIRDNIAAFGGDPSNLTIAGQSGGAAACGAILASPLMKGLFQHICILSGPIYWGFMQPPAREEVEKRGVEFMKKIGCKSIAEMRRMDAWELYDQAGSDIMAFNFCIDGYFLPESVQDIMENGKFNDVDVMISVCSQEFPVAGAKGLPLDQLARYMDEKFPDNAEKMKAWYPAKTPQEAAKQASTIASDIMLMGAVRIAQLCAKYGRKAFVYRIAKEMENDEGKLIGSLHCAEMPYLFGNINKGGRSPFHDYRWVEEDYAFMRTVMGYYANFMRNGDPNGKCLPEWKQYKEDYDVLALENDSHMADQSRVKPLYDYYMSILMKDVKGNSRRFMMRLPGPGPITED